MRAILAIIGLAVIVILAMAWLGMINLNLRSGALPEVKVEGGKAPAVQADVGKVDMGYTNKTIQVPTVVMENKTIQVPRVEVEKARQPVEAN
ncbi:hypothetical protein [Sphingomonas turrisvirgatae]|uniref:Uncharacterized protein n=1 Tax=Sphingomonas turrisvirgatae TaxID=1888892 RepID=A0A1E3LY27_9SPHN|nr:hypothetical protein [Sphingomonas turrisvirgatae]ODP38686.1 hypothetical protein BFL28_01245 [Sphingomonas turrisvirgatae]